MNSKIIVTILQQAAKFFNVYYISEIKERAKYALLVCFWHTAHAIPESLAHVIWPFEPSFEFAYFCAFVPLSAHTSPSKPRIKYLHVRILITKTPSLHTSKWVDNNAAECRIKQVREVTEIDKANKHSISQKYLRREGKLLKT